MTMTLEQYLERIGRCRAEKFGQRFRQQFRDFRGTAEMGMLAAPTEEEYQGLRRAVEIMTAAEKDAPENLSEKQIDDIAASAGVERGDLQIFLNGYALARRKENG